MGQLRHGGTRKPAAVRQAIQQSQASITRLAKHYALHPKTVAKWEQRTQVHDAPMGAKHPCSTVLTPEQEALMVTFRKHTLRPLDDCLSASQATTPHLMRSALHRCLKRHGISRLPNMAGEKPVKTKFQADPIGDFHLDMAEARTGEGRLSLCVAIDRACKCADAELPEQANNVVAAQFLRNVMAAIPYEIHTVLSDHGLPFTNLTCSPKTGPRHMLESSHERGGPS